MGAFSKQSFRDCSGGIDKPGTGAQKNQETRVLFSQQVGHISESELVVSEDCGGPAQQAASLPP